MSISRRTLLLALLAASGALAWQNLIYATDEIAVLTTQGTGHTEHYASVWYVEANHALWIRAENREQPWLPDLLANPRIELAIGGQTRSYTAQPIDIPKYQAFVDAEFRKKYGLADWVRSLSGHRDTLPIQLEPN